MQMKLSRLVFMSHGDRPPVRKTASGLDQTHDASVDICSLNMKFPQLIRKLIRLIAPTAHAKHSNSFHEDQKKQVWIGCLEEKVLTCCNGDPHASVSTLMRSISRQLQISANRALASLSTPTFAVSRVTVPTKNTTPSMSLKMKENIIICPMETSIDPFPKIPTFNLPP